MTDRLNPQPPDRDETPGQPDSALRVSVWRLGGDGTTGDFLGDATLATTTFVVLHPRAAATVLADGEAVNRLRVVVDTEFSRYVVDGGVILGNDTVPGQLVAVELDFPIAEEPTPIPTPSLGEDPARFTALEEFLLAAGAADPTQPPAAPDGPGFERRESTRMGGVRPPWCHLWPGCWGCR